MYHANFWRYVLYQLFMLFVVNIPTKCNPLQKSNVIQSFWGLTIKWILKITMYFFRSLPRNIKWWNIVDILNKSYICKKKFMIIGMKRTSTWRWKIKKVQWPTLVFTQKLVVSEQNCVILAGVPVSFSRGCLYSNPPLYRYRANDSQGMCTVCTLSSGRQPGWQSGTALFFSSVSVADLPKMKWIHDKEKKGSSNMVVKLTIV